MFTSVCNFLYDTFFHRPEIKFLRRKNDSKESLFEKRLKLASDCFCHTNSPPDQHCSAFMHKGNADCSDDEECCIIAELPRRKKAGGSVNLNKEGDIVQTTTSNNSYNIVSWPSLSLSKDFSQKYNKDTEVKCESNTPGKNVTEKSYFKNKFFNNVRSPLSNGKMARYKISFKNHLRKRMNFLQESYRLTEKHQYMQLLQSQSLLSFQSEKPFLKSIKHRTECIPVIDLTDEKVISSEDNSKSDSESHISEDQDIQILGEFAGVRSFQDILKIRPINSKETFGGIFYKDSKNTPSLLSKKESSDHIISLLDDDDDDDDDEDDDDDDIHEDEKDEDEDEEEYANQKLKFGSLEEKLKNYVKITGPTNEEAYSFKEHYLPKLTKEQEMQVSNALIPEPKQEVLVKGFGLQITRHDMQTLKGLNWLNDVVIDFYMNLIVERSKLSYALPKVYAFNTFFYPKLVTSGYDSLKRWTKKVDIFSFDMILVPIHLGMHWCLSVIDFRSKSIWYYDSIGSPNNKCLDALLMYLRAESLCKKKTVLHASNWEKHNAKDIPQQMNGSDCGVFSCMFAEHDGETNDYPPVKQMKLESTSTYNINSLPYEYFSNMNRLENCFKKENEFYILNEDNSKKWDIPSVMARQSIHRSNYTLRSSTLLDKRKMELNSNSQIPKRIICPSSDMCEIEVVKYVNKNSNHNSEKLIQKNKISSRIFSTYRSSTSRQNNDKLQPAFQNSIKKSLNFLQESYRLSEKIQYMQLLQQTTKILSFVSPFTIQNINKKGNKSSVPLIDLTKERNIIINRSRENIPWTSKTKPDEQKGYIDIDFVNKDVSEVNTLQDILKTHPVTEKSIIEEILSHHSSETAEKQRQAELEAAKLKILNATNRKAYNDALEEKLRQYMRITTPALEEIEPEKDKYILPSLSKEQDLRINSALIPSPAGEVLVEKFGLQIKRRDVQTLKGLNWLNDEVINFYMNLIMERGKQTNMPKVYAFNTFFYPKLISSGHSSLKRWTKKVDIFSHDMILVPVHLGMHWCMSVIDFRSKEVKYYDSMGSANNQCLEALLSYLEAESLDKKGKTYSTNDWEQKNAEDIPQQMNGSDCGVFSCMFAEHLARDAPLLFSQDHMPYFRRKMVLEIMEAKLLT